MVLFAQMFAAANKTVTPWLTELGSYAVGPCNLKKKGALRSDLAAPAGAGARFELASFSPSPDTVGAQRNVSPTSLCTG